MKRRPIVLHASDCPCAFRPLLAGAAVYDSSSSPEAQVLFLDKDGGYFLKSAAKGTLAREAALTEYFHGKGLAAKVLSYLSEARDWLLTEKINGGDCTSAEVLARPERLAETIGERLAFLHGQDGADCPVQNHTAEYLAKAGKKYRGGSFDRHLFTDEWSYASGEEAWQFVASRGHLLQTDTLLHGDYCLPNIILDKWRFGGLVDLGSGGLGDRHVDIFWGAWTLLFNLKTDRYRNRFYDAYGRGRIEEEKLRIVAACELFG